MKLHDAKKIMELVFGKSLHLANINYLDRWDNFESHDKLAVAVADHGKNIHAYVALHNDADYSYEFNYFTATTPDRLLAWAKKIKDVIAYYDKNVVQ